MLPYDNPCQNRRSADSANPADPTDVGDLLDEVIDQPVFTDAPDPYIGLLRLLMLGVSATLAIYFIYLMLSSC